MVREFTVECEREGKVVVDVVEVAGFIVDDDDDNDDDDNDDDNDADDDDDDDDDADDEKEEEEVEEDEVEEEMVEGKARLKAKDIITFLPTHPSP